MGTGEFMTWWSSESDMCDGRCCTRAEGGSSAGGAGGAGGAGLGVWAGGGAGWERVWEPTDGLRASAEPFEGCEGARRSVDVWNLDMRSCRVDDEAPFSTWGRELTATNPPGEG